MGSGGRGVGGGGGGGADVEGNEMKRNVINSLFVRF